MSAPTPIKPAYSAEQTETFAAYAESCIARIDAKPAAADSFERNARRNVRGKWAEVQTAALGVSDLLNGHDGFESAPYELDAALDAAPHFDAQILRSYEPAYRTSVVGMVAL